MWWLLFCFCSVVAKIPVYNKTPSSYHSHPRQTPSGLRLAPPFAPEEACNVGSPRRPVVYCGLMRTWARVCFSTLRLNHTLNVRCFCVVFVLFLCYYFAVPCALRSGFEKTSVPVSVLWSLVLWFLSGLCACRLVSPNTAGKRKRITPINAFYV